MAQLKLSQADMQDAVAGNTTKFLANLRNAVEQHDYDSGWVKPPAGGVFKHKLGIAPKSVQVYGSSNPNGETFTALTGHTVDKNTITVTGSNQFYRVLANR